MNNSQTVSNNRNDSYIGYVSLIVVAGIVLLAFGFMPGAHAVIDFETEPYYEGNGFGMGYAYNCGADYQFASGLTIFTVAKEIDVNGSTIYVSHLGYYADTYDINGEFVEYELVEMLEYVGGEQVMESLGQYWYDKQISAIC